MRQKKIDGRGVREHLGANFAHVSEQKKFVVSPPTPLKPGFEKNIDTFFNYLNYSIIYTLPYYKCK